MAATDTVLDIADVRRLVTGTGPCASVCLNLLNTQPTTTPLTTCHCGGGRWQRATPSGRHPDGSSQARQTAVAQTVEGYAAADSAALLDWFVAQWRPGGTPVEGIAATLTALAEGRVEPC